MLFDISKLNLFVSKKKTMSHAVYKCLEYINNISNFHFTRNADGLLSRRKINTTVGRVRVTPEKFKVNY